jgi:hypothetical protein
MGKTYSFPPKGVDPHSGPVHGVGPKGGRGVNAAKFGTGIGAHHVHDVGGMDASIGSRLDLNADEIHIEGIGNLREAFLDLKAKVELLLEAIEVGHQRGDDGECVEGCWSCRIQETIKSVRVARKIGGQE